MMFQDGGQALVLNDNSYYEGKMRLARLNVADTALDFFREQEKYFGRSSTLVYVDGPSTQTSQLFLGGVSDNFERKKASDVKEWGPAVFQLKPDGEKSELYKIKLNSSWNSNSGQIVQVDHMKRDSVQKKLFGTTRTSESYNNPQPGLEIHIFIVELKNDGAIDNKKLKVKKFDSTAVGANSYVTGIDKSLSVNSF